MIDYYYNKNNPNSFIYDNFIKHLNRELLRINVNSVKFALLDNNGVNKQLFEYQTNTDDFLILIVFELNRANIDFLKLADHVIFTNVLQQKIVNEFLHLEYDCSVIELPDFSLSQKKAEDKYTLLFDCENWDFTKEYFDYKIWDCFKVLGEVDDVYDGDYENLEVIIPLTKLDEEYIRRFIDENNWCAKKLNINIYDRNKLTLEAFDNIISTSVGCHYLREEYSINEFNESFQNKDDGMIYDSIISSLLISRIRSFNVKLSKEKTVSDFGININGLTFNDWATKIKKIIDRKFDDRLLEKKEIIKKREIDTLDDINIIVGKPLNNDFVFSVCFRNQSTNIERCLDSIINLKRDKDFGVVLIDDLSTDNSIDIINRKLKNTKIDYCLVSNKERKYAARNFYNVIHYLVQNDETIIIELDGDDYLLNSDVLNVLNKYYINGALKTSGSYAFHDNYSGYFSMSDYESHHKNIDFSKPWDSMSCTAWLHMRTAKRRVLKNVEIDYFFKRNTSSWLIKRHDTAMQPRVIELSNGKSVFIPEELYCYDVTGENHDHENESEAYDKAKSVYHAMKDSFHVYTYKES